MLLIDGQKLIHFILARCWRGMYTTGAADGTAFSYKTLIGFPSFQGQLLSSPTSSKGYGLLMKKMLPSGSLFSCAANGRPLPRPTHNERYSEA